MLTEEQRELLARMQIDNQNSDPPFRTLGHWEKVNDEFSQLFDEIGIGLDPISQPYNYHFAGLPRPEDRQVLYHWVKYMGGEAGEPIEEIATRTLHAKIAELDELGILDYHPTGPSWGILTAIEILYSIQSHVPILTEPLTLVDLGAGWGRIGYVLRSFNKDARYIVYDLPESLLISLTCLPAMLGETAHPYNHLSDEPGVYFLGAHKLLELPDKSADVLINVASFQEMKHHYINMYLDIVDKKAKTMYSMNREGRASPDRLRKDGWEKLFARHALWSNIYWEAMFKL